MSTEPLLSCEARFALRLHTYCPPLDSQKDYNEGVRYYTTKPMNGGTTFKCTFCQHSVTTLDFDSAHGNRRTQAATTINQHVASLHVRTSVPAKLGGRGAL
jgi:hypothetical protein